MYKRERISGHGAMQLIMDCIAYYAIPIFNIQSRLLSENKTWVVTLILCAACSKSECGLLQRNSLVLIEFHSLTISAVFNRHHLPYSQSVISVLVLWSTPVIFPGSVGDGVARKRGWGDYRTITSKMPLSRSTVKTSSTQSNVGLVVPRESR